jgi:hypothetical protein
MNFKSIAKKNKFLNLINSQLKSYKLKKDLKKLSNKYNRYSTRNSFYYNHESAIKEFKHWHKINVPTFIPESSKSLRVFWVGSSKDQDESGFLQALQRISNVTIFYNFKEEYGTWGGDSDGFDEETFHDVRRANDSSLLSQIKIAKKNGDIDLLIGQMWAHRVSKEALILVQSMGIPVINISMDDRLPLNWSSNHNIRLGAVGLAQGTNLVLTTSPETCLWFGLEGCPAIFWSLASSKDVFTPKNNMTRDIDVLFIGNKYGIRGKIIDYLKKNKIKVQCYGSGWSNGHISAPEMAALSKRSKIILGVGAIGHSSDVYTLKLRDFDAPMSGALYITQRNPDLLNFFSEGNEIECYSTFKEALNKINYYLENSFEREKIANKGLEKCLSSYTWEGHLKKTFRKLGLITQKNLDTD